MTVSRARALWGKRAEANERADRRVLIVPAPFGAPRRERVARYDVAILQRGLRLVMQRRANVFDRINKAQAVGERLQIGSLIGRHTRRRRQHELGKIE